jgi:hypothetical protein
MFDERGMPLLVNYKQKTKVTNVTVSLRSFITGKEIIKCAYSGDFGH